MAVARIFNVSLVVVVAALLVAGLAAARMAGQDPAVVNAKNVKVTLDNPRVRVMEATLKPGEKEQMHSHPAYVVYVVAGGTVRNHAADGTTSETTFVPGQTIYREPITHWSENVGTTTIHTVVFELKGQ
jgi:quercetin dioxygenase-like cupin family protein